MRAVVDTNVLVSALISPGGPPARILAAIVMGRLRPVLCADILAEYRDVLARPRLRIHPDRAGELLRLLDQVAEWVMVPAYAGVPPLPDEDDWPFVAAAQVADCSLITGNLRHFPPATGVQVVTARAWLESVQAC